jgi:hypothetical protein
MAQNKMNEGDDRNRLINETIKMQHAEFVEATILTSPCTVSGSVIRQCCQLQKNGNEVGDIEYGAR